MEGFQVDLTGKTALITGGTRGLGKAIARAMGASGARVAVCGRKQENLDRALEELEAEGISAFGIPANVGSSEQVQALFSQVSERFGGLDILVNNVGMNVFTPRVSEADEGLWNKTIQTNLTGTFLCCKEAVRLFRERGGGKIVNISSVAAHRAQMGLGIYCVAKAGVEMLTRVLARELASQDIQVNAVAPAMIRTDFSKPLWSNEEMLKEVLKGIPAGRIGEVEDVVGIVLFLVSEASRFITGAVVPVDGGSLT